MKDMSSAIMLAVILGIEVGTVILNLKPKAPKVMEYVEKSELEIDFKNKFEWQTFHVSAYALPCTSLKNDGSIGPSKHNVTKAGTPPIAGITAAVDPKVIPLGSTIRIAGLGDRLATDTGKYIKGSDIDIFVDTCEEARQFGTHKMKARVITRH